MKKGFARKLGMAALVAAALTQAPAAMAQAMIGFDETGTGTYDAYAGLWVNDRDSGLATGFTGVVGDPVVFTAQTNVILMVPGTPDVSVNANLANQLAGAYEITKVMQIREVITSFEGTLGGASIAEFGMTSQAGIDVDGIATNGEQQLAIYFDANANDGSRSVPGDGAGTVRCYGAGVTSTAAMPPCVDDGILILSASLVENVSSFTATTGTAGAGTFNLVFRIDFVDPRYLDVATFNIIGETFTGSTITPPGLGVRAAEVWTGANTTPPDCVRPSCVHMEIGLGVPGFPGSFQTFFGRVPEPGSLALMSLGLLGLGAWRRRGLARA